MLVCLGLAAFAAGIGLAALIGAFLAGMIVAETKDQHPIEEEVEPLYAFFPPFFFAFIGIELELDALFDGETLALLALITVLAIVTKLVPSYLASRRSLGSQEAAMVGVGMTPRGEVGIVVASIGATEGVVDAQLFAVVVGMSILTTLVAPFALRRLTSWREPPDLARSRSRSTSSSAIWTALVAAPLRRLSATTQRSRARSLPGSRRIRPTKTSSLAGGVDRHRVAAGGRVVDTVTPGAAASSSRARSRLQRLPRLDVDRLGVAVDHRHPDAGGADPDLAGRRGSCGSR